MKIISFSSSKYRGLWIMWYGFDCIEWDVVRSNRRLWLDLGPLVVELLW